MKIDLAGNKKSYESTSNSEQTAGDSEEIAMESSAADAIRSRNVLECHGSIGERNNQTWKTIPHQQKSFS